MSFDFDVRGQQGMDLIQWRKRYYGLWNILARSNGLKVKHYNDGFVSYNHTDINWWTGVVLITSGLLWCFYQLFGLSFWWHPAEDPLVSKWCNAKLFPNHSNKETKSSRSCVAWRYVNFQQIFFFGWTTPLRHLMNGSACPSTRLV